MGTYVLMGTTARMFRLLSEYTATTPDKKNGNGPRSWISDKAQSAAWTELNSREAE